MPKFFAGARIERVDAPAGVTREGNAGRCNGDAALRRIGKRLTPRYSPAANVDSGHNPGGVLPFGQRPSAERLARNV